MALTKYRNAIIRLLHEHLSRPVVMLRQNADRPLKPDKSTVDYPFLGYSVLATFIQDRETGNYAVTEVPSTDPRFKVDLMESIELQPQFTLSFTAYAKTSEEAKELSLRAWEFFKLQGYHALARENIIVVELMNIGSKDLFEVDDYERREGFDVRFRTLHRIENRLETIETYKVKKEYS